MILVTANTIIISCRFQLTKLHTYLTSATQNTIHQNKSCSRRFYQKTPSLEISPQTLPPKENLKTGLTCTPDPNRPMSWIIFWKQAVLFDPIQLGCNISRGYFGTLQLEYLVQLSRLFQNFFLLGDLSKSLLDYCKTGFNLVELTGVQQLGPRSKCRNSSLRATEDSSCNQVHAHNAYYHINGHFPGSVVS